MDLLYIKAKYVTLANIFVTFSPSFKLFDIIITTYTESKGDCMPVCINVINYFSQTKSFVLNPCAAPNLLSHTPFSASLSFVLSFNECFVWS